MPSLSPHAEQGHLTKLLAQTHRDLLLPAMAERLLSSGDFSDCRSRSLPRRLAQDEALSERLIRWINSPLFNLDQELSTLDQAAAILGETGLAQLATVGSIRTLFQPHRRVESYSREQLWRHSVAVGAVGSLISRICGLASPQEALLAGILHDVGLLATDRVSGADFRALMERLDPLTDTHVTERELFQWDHQQWGAEILVSWGFPQAFVDVARYHHEPHRAESSPHADLVRCIAVANYLCSRCGWTSLGLHNVSPPPDAVFHQLGIDTKTLTILWRQLYATLESTRAIG